MARTLAKNAMHQLAAAFGELGWKATIKSRVAEVEATMAIGAEVEHVASFVAIYNKSDAICFQVGVGARIHTVNRLLGDLHGSGDAARLTAYALVNHLCPTSAKHAGWCFPAGSDTELAMEARLAVQEVLGLREVQAFFSSLTDVFTYIEAVEQAKWPLVSISEPYIAALISVGRITDAIQVAEEAEREYLKAVSMRGASVRDSDLAFLRRVRMLSP